MVTPNIHTQLSVFPRPWDARSGKGYTRALCLYGHTCKSHEYKTLPALIWTTAWFVLVLWNQLVVSLGSQYCNGQWERYGFGNRPSQPVAGVLFVWLVIEPLVVPHRGRWWNSKEKEIIDDISFRLKIKQKKREREIRREYHFLIANKTVRNRFPPCLQKPPSWFWLLVVSWNLDLLNVNAPSLRILHPMLLNSWSQGVGETHPFQQILWDRTASLVCTC